MKDKVLGRSNSLGLRESTMITVASNDRNSPADSSLKVCNGNISPPFHPIPNPAMVRGVDGEP